MGDDFRLRASLDKGELTRARQAGTVTRALARMKSPVTPPLTTVTIGVTFRTDSRGVVHETHDKKGLKAINDLTPKPPFTVIPVTLPRGASGGVTPARDASLSDLDGIDILYIPGAPAAPSSQEATSADPVLAAEERNYARTEEPTGSRPTGKNSGPRYDRKLREHTEARSRAPYELQLIGYARDRGIPVLAVCAGSWRLLESYGGKVRTLPIEHRARHKFENGNAAQTWGLGHGVTMTDVPGGMVRATGPDGGRMRNVNSTHWAVACERFDQDQQINGLARRNPNGLDPNEMLEVAALADDPVTATIEAFESKYGAPTVGVQWHPETYMPGMLGEAQGSQEGRDQAKALLRFIAEAGFAAKTRRFGISDVLLQEEKAFSVLKAAGKSASQSKFESAGFTIQATQQILSRDKWSTRMDSIVEAIETFKESKDAMDAQKPVAAGNLWREGQSILRGVGVLV